MSEGILLRDEPFVDLKALRALAHTIIETSPLIQACSRGDRSAVKAFKIGFWPFVEGFGQAIDEHPFPVRPLVKRFGKERIREYFFHVGAAVKEMSQEEGEHAGWWRTDALELGIELKTEVEFGTRKVHQLLMRARDSDMTLFLCHLAGTEFIAEELSRFLCNSRDFTALFSAGVWNWGEVHLRKHPGPSHLEIDIDLATAYETVQSSQHPKDERREDLTQKIRESIIAFQEAASEIYLSVYK